MDRIEKKNLQAAYRDTLMELKPNLMVTHNFWGKYKAQTACNRMTQFYNAIQRKKFGRDWAKQHDRPWPVAYGFREHPNSNPHYHVLLRACPKLTAAMMEKGPDLWLKLARHGQLNVQAIEPGKLHPIIYCTKHLARNDAAEDVFIYSDTRQI